MEDLDQYDDMPKEIFRAVMKFAAALDELCRLRKTRKDRMKEIIHHYAHARNGDFMARENQQVAFDTNLATIMKEANEGKWKTDESRRAQYCCDRLQEEREKNSKLQDENYALKKKIKELEASNRPRTASNPL